MEEKTNGDWEEHFPYDSIVGDQEFRTMNLAGHTISVTTASTLPVDTTLAFYLLQNSTMLQASNNKNVLVVGNQDQGLAGVAALKIGATSVVFSGSSAVSMRSCTWANIFLNCPNKMTSVRCLSAAGSDWAAVSNSSIKRFGLVILSVEADIFPDKWNEVQRGLDEHLDAGGMALLITRSTGSITHGRMSAADRYDALEVWRGSNTTSTNLITSDADGTHGDSDWGSSSCDGAPIPEDCDGSSSLPPTVLSCEVVILSLRARQQNQ